MELPGVRKYGDAPYRVAVLHGGPGGIGSAAGLARGIFEYGGTGTVEPLQSAYSVAGLIEELNRQLRDPQITTPLILVGHSWGAWLAALFAERHPEMVEKIILVSPGAVCPGTDIDAIRKERFTAETAAEYDRLIARLGCCAEAEKNILLEHLGNICQRADTFCPAELPPEPPSEFNGEMYARVWNEAAQMRHNGILAMVFRRLRVPVSVIHGDYDPHPADGVSRVMHGYDIHFRHHLLTRCGHTPWREKYARDAFFDILLDMIG